MLRLLPCLGLLLLPLLPGCASDQGFETREVSREDYGATWPLTVEDAVLGCEPGGVATLTVGGRSYGLAGLSAGEDVPTGFRRIWAEDPEGAGSDLSALADDAGALCD